MDDIGERYCLNYDIVVKLYHFYTQFPRNVHLGLSSANRDLFGVSWLSWLLRLRNTIIYLLADQFVFDNYLWQFYGIRPANHVVGKFLLQGLECCKDAQMKAYVIIKLTANWKRRCKVQKQVYGKRYESIGDDTKRCRSPKPKLQ